MFLPPDCFHARSRWPSSGKKTRRIVISRRAGNGGEHGSTQHPKICRASASSRLPTQLSSKLAILLPPIMQGWTDSSSTLQPCAFATQLHSPHSTPEVRRSDRAEIGARCAVFVLDLRGRI